MISLYKVLNIKDFKTSTLLIYSDVETVNEIYQLIYDLLSAYTYGY